MNREYFFQKLDTLLEVYQEKRKLVRSATGVTAQRAVDGCLTEANIFWKGIESSLIDTITDRRIKGVLTKEEKEKFWQYFKKNCPEFVQE